MQIAAENRIDITLKIRRWRQRTGSSPVTGTKKLTVILIELRRAFLIPADDAVSGKSGVDEIWKTVYIQFT